MQRRQREDVFPSEHAQSTRSRLPKVGCGEKPLSSYVTLLRQVCSNAVGQASALRLKKQNSGSVPVFALPAQWDSRPPCIFSPLHTQPGHSPRSQLPRKTSFKLRYERGSGRYNRHPMPSHVAAPELTHPTLRRWGRRLNHPLTRYFLLQPATESHSIEESQKVLLERPGKANVSWNAGFCGRWQGSVWLHLPDQRPACRQARTEEKATACTPSIAYHVTCLPAQTGFRIFWKFLPCMRPRLSHCTNYLFCALDNKLKLTWQW